MIDRLSVDLEKFRGRNVIFRVKPKRAREKWLAIRIDRGLPIIRRFEFAGAYRDIDIRFGSLAERIALIRTIDFYKPAIVLGLFGRVEKCDAERDLGIDARIRRL